MLRDDEPIRPVDLRRICRDCEQEFTISAGEQSWLSSRELSLPRRCVECRREMRRARNYHAERGD